MKALIVLFFLQNALAHTLADPSPKDEAAEAVNDCTGTWRKGDYKIVPYPDTNAQYLSYQVKIPKGQKLSLKIEGKFPSARYLSYHVYDQATEDSLSSVLDSDFIANPGSKNPFVPGVERDLPDQHYSVWATNDGPPKKGQLSLPYSEEKDQLIDIWFRAYLQDGEIVPPKITAYNAKTSQAIPCPEPAPKARSIATERKLGDWLAADHIAERSVLPFENGEVHFYAPDSTSLGANDHNKYIGATLDAAPTARPGAIGYTAQKLMLQRKGVMKEVGDVTVLKFKVPSFPNTEKGLKQFSGKEDVRYWSLCVSGERTDTSNCLVDSGAKIVKGEDGENYAVVVIGPDDAEFRSNVEKRGFNYLDRSKHKVPTLFFRQMLAREDFAGRIEKVKRLPSDKAKATPEELAPYYAEASMGAFAPVGRQCYRGEDFFEKYCGLAGIKALEKPAE